MNGGKSTRPAGKPAMPPEVAAALKAAQAREVELQTTMRRLSAVLHLAAFACETRRVLQDVDALARAVPSFGELYRSIEAAAQWTCIENTTAEVLQDVAGELAEVGFHLETDGGPAFPIGAALEAAHV